MKLFSKISLVTKLTFTTTVLAAVCLGFTFYYVTLQMHDALLALSIEKLETEVTAEASEISLLIDDVQTTVSSLRETPPVQGLIRARYNDGLDELSGSTAEQWAERLQTIFRGEVQSAKMYDQLRYLDKNGQELVRVDYVNGIAVEVTGERLQNKSNRSYFTETVSLPIDSFYVSQAGLNREGDPPEISIPHRPVVRYSKPVYDELTGDVEGALVVNVRLKELIARSGLLRSVTSELYILDEDGYFIENPNPQKEWGSEQDLGTGFSLQTEFSDLTVESFTDESGNLVLPDGFLAYAKIRPNANDINRYWIVLEFTPSAVIYRPIDNIMQNTYFVAIGAFLAIFVLFIYLIRYLLSPLTKLSAGAVQLGKGNFNISLPVNSEDEIGRLTQAFNSMAKNLSDLYSSLEQKVKQRTADLEKSEETLKDQKQAILNILEDIESEKAVAENLANDLKKFELAVNNTSDMVVITDTEGIVLYANKAVETVTGYSPEETIEKKAAALWKIPMPKEFYQELWQTIKIDKKPFEAQLKNRRKNGMEYFSDLRISPVVNEVGDVIFFVGIERDISQEKAVDQAKTEFVSLASHQLRTPLSSMNWYLEMLLSGDAGKLNQEQTDYLNEIYFGSKRMVELVNALLSVSRLELGTFIMEPKPTNVKELAESVIEEQSQQITDRQQKLTTDLAADLPVMNVDDKLLRMIFENLLSNASKYTPAGGELKLSLSKSKQQIQIVVSDTGIGIPKEQQAHIFTKLFRADNAKNSDTDGTGLGLYIIKSIVEKLGGKISFVSTVNQGTTFTVLIPLETKVLKDSKSDSDE